MSDYLVYVKYTNLLWPNFDYIRNIFIAVNNQLFKLSGRTGKFVSTFLLFM